MRRSFGEHDKQRDEVLSRCFLAGTSTDGQELILDSATPLRFAAGTLAYRPSNLAAWSLSSRDL